MMISSSQSSGLQQTQSSVHPNESASNLGLRNDVEDDDDVVEVTVETKPKPPEHPDFTAAKEMFAKRENNNPMYSYYTLVWQNNEARIVCKHCKNRTKPTNYLFNASHGTKNYLAHARTHGFKGKDDATASDVAGSTLSEYSPFFKPV